MRFILIFITALVVVSCGTAVSYDYDSKTNFASYQTYDFYPNISSNLSDLDNIRIMKATDSILQMRGFIKSDSAQFLINFFVKEFTSQSKSSIGVGIGGGGSNGSIGVSGGIPVGGNIINQQLTIDFIDNQKDELIWQAIGIDELKVKSSPTEKSNYYFNMINKILKGYPPKK